MFRAIYTNSKIESIYVHPLAIAGCNLHIRRGSVIDSSSAIQSYTYIGKNVDITNSQVGSYCSIADNVVVGPGTHDMTRVSTSALFYSDSDNVLRKQSVVIESDVWIGVNAVIIQGVTIGLGAVIGASAVVTKDVPPFAVVAGVPAKIIRFRVCPEMVQAISVSQWWIHEPKDALRIQQKINRSL